MYYSTLITIICYYHSCHILVGKLEQHKPGRIKPGRIKRAALSLQNQNGYTFDVAG